MRLVPLMLLALVACRSSGDDFPSLDPPGDDDTSMGGGDGGYPADAGTGSDAAASGPLTGKICMMSSLQDPSACTLQARAGLQVARADDASSTVQTASDGSFSLSRRAGDVQPVLLTITDPTQVFAPGAFFYDPALASQDLLVLDRNTLSDVEIASSIVETPGAGNVFVYVQRAGQPVTDGELGQLSGAQPYYDQGDGFVLAQVPPTGATGLAAFFNAGADDVSPLPQVRISEGGVQQPEVLIVPVLGNRNTIVVWRLAP